jgi:ankyrin repeat protein
MSSTMVSLQERAKETYDRAEENVSLAFEQEASQEQNRRRQSVSREKGDFNAELLETVGHPEGGDAELVLQLLTQGASVNVQHSESGWNPLMLACFHGHAACAELLIEHRANVNSSAGKRRSSPLHTACCSGDMSVVQRLILSGADIGAQNRDGKSAYDFCITNQHEGAAQALCEAMIVMQLHHHDVTAAGPGLAHAFELAEANTALLHLLQLPEEEHETEAVVNLINERGARLECVGGPHQWTPLMIAAFKGYDQTMRQLLAMGASVCPSDGANLTCWCCW